ncbi:hypothetical protein ECC02_012750 [Trypanosoma cruzi]|uniref:Uncharacterized protein n=1 Tax=Trypanosoma cruzi TaxID=5693 RepID=A0A7J6XK97_TRYCR|nr:hypothetical protein ECC02_012750 [Trypanosoma cruzi]
MRARRKNRQQLNTGQHAHNSMACKTHPQLPPMDGKKGARVRQENKRIPVQKRIPKRREKETKKSSPTVATSNNASNNNKNKHHTRQLTEAVGSLSPTFMAARHRTPRVSIAPPPSSFPRHTIGSIRTRRHATLNDPTGNRPTTVAETTHPRRSTQRNIISRGPRRQKNVISTVWPAHGTIDRRNREVRQALDQGLSTHIHTMLF